MDQASLNTLNFCVEFVKNNYSERSQTSMCIVWINQAKDLLEKDDALSSAVFIANELEAIENYLTGKASSLTSADIDSKIQMIETLLEDA